MKIAMITNNYKPFIGGVPISVERLKEGLERQGHTVYVFAPSYDNQEAEDNVIRFRTYKHRLCNGKFVIPHMLDKKMESTFVDLDIDMIHVHHPMLYGWLGLYLGKKYKVPVAFTYHTRYEQYLHNIKLFGKMESKVESGNMVRNLGYNKILKQIKQSYIPSYVRGYSNLCDMIFAPTDSMKEYLEEIGVKKDIEVLPTGLCSSFFEEDTTWAQAIRKRYDRNKSFVFCTVSRLSKEKNLNFLIEGIHTLKQKVGNNFTMLVIGEGPEKENLIKKVAELDLNENIQFIGSVPNDEIADYYKASDLFLFASKSETQGIVLLEAMSAKTPVVAIKASGVKDVVVNGMNGYMTTENIEEWAKQIEVLMNNCRKLQQLQQGAYKTACEYSSDSVALMAAKYYETARMNLQKQKEYDYEKKFKHSSETIKQTIYMLP